MQPRSTARERKAGGDRRRRLAGCLMRRAGLGAALILAVVVSLGLTGAAQDAWGPVRPEPRGGSGPVVELPPTWQPEPTHRYHREILLLLEMEMAGLEGMAMPPMEARIRQEMVLETSARDESGTLYAQVTMSKPQVLGGSPELAEQLEAAEASTFWIRMTEDGRWDVLAAVRAEGLEPVDDDSEAFVVGVRGPVWPRAPRVGSSWELDLTQFVGLAEDPLGEIPGVVATATLEAVESVGGEQVARILFQLPETQVEMDGDPEMPFMAGMRARVAVDGAGEIRTRDGLALSSRLQVTSVSSLGPGAPEVRMSLQVEEQAMADEPLTDPPVPPAEVLQAR